MLAHPYTFVSTLPICLYAVRTCRLSSISRADVCGARLDPHLLRAATQTSAPERPSARRPRRRPWTPRRTASWCTPPPARPACPWAPSSWACSSPSWAAAGRPRRCHRPPGGPADRPRAASSHGEPARGPPAPACAWPWPPPLLLLRPGARRQPRLPWRRACRPSWATWPPAVPRLPAPAAASCPSRPRQPWPSSPSADDPLPHRPPAPWWPCAPRSSPSAWPSTRASSPACSAARRRPRRPRPPAAPACRCP
mmetsp:Transcript_36427/g.91525  ORF Transcript_36427/g.91525 Transcript_36427/m.91525 type:complete len:253 (-) Transcript_36427:974-1732(-)